MIKYPLFRYFSLVSRGINYCDSYALEFPRIIKSKLTVNRYLYRLKNFHESPLIKFSVHFVCLSNIFQTVH